MHSELEGAIQHQPFLSRAIRRMRTVWSELAFSSSTRRQQLRPDLPDADLPKLRDLIASCLADQSVATAARAQAAKVGYAYLTLSEQGRRRFLELLARDFDLDPDEVREAVDAHLSDPSSERYAQLQKALRPPRVQLLTMLNSLPDGFKFLVDLRADLLSFLDGSPSLKVVDHDLTTLFEAWFDVGLLSFVDIDWNAPASLLEKLIAYEAVHEIRDWSDLKNRLDHDRRCYAFFHPKIPNEPLIFVEVALTQEVPARIDELLDLGAPVIAAEEATTAVFYSISSTQRGLNGISFGSFLLKQVMDRLAGQLPGLKTFVTLSPIPGFRRWLDRVVSEGRLEALLDRGRRTRAAASEAHDAAGLAALLATEAWLDDEQLLGDLEEPLVQLCCHYLLHERNRRGEPLDPVERFHILNGARIERINPMADTSPKGLEQSYGLMVNYLYEPERIEHNYELAMRGSIAASPAIEKLDTLTRRERGGT